MAVADGLHYANVYQAGDEINIRVQYISMPAVRAGTVQELSRVPSVEYVLITTARF